MSHVSDMLIHVISKKKNNKNQYNIYNIGKDVVLKKNFQKNWDALIIPGDLYKGVGCSTCGGDVSLKIEEDVINSTVDKPQYCLEMTCNPQESNACINQQSMVFKDLYTVPGLKELMDHVWLYDKRFKSLKWSSVNDF